MLATQESLCEFCQNITFKYTCPKCNALYCSVACYKSPAHIKCSEEFYKNCIQDEVNIKSTKDAQGDMHKIYNILKRIKEADADINPIDFDVSSLDSDSNDDDDVMIGNGNESSNADKFYTVPELSARLQGVNINNADDVWSCLTVEEQQEFQQLVASGDIMKLVPNYKPWWSKQQNSKIVVLSDKKVEVNIPTICQNIPRFTDICKKTPSPCLHYNLWNILAAYACVVRFFAGEQLSNSREAIAHIVNLSATLKYGTNFEDADDAIISVEMEAITAVGNIAAAGIQTPLVDSRQQLQRDARQLMFTVENKLAALSDILKLFLLAKKEQTKDKTTAADFQKFFALCNGSVELTRSKLQLLIKKIEFMLAYVHKDYEIV